MLELFCTDIRDADESRARQAPRSPQRGSAFGVSLLEYAVRRVWDVHLPAMTRPGGKPEFIDAPGMHFSISHSRTHVLVAVSDGPVGVDVETRRDIRQQTMEMLMDAQERAQFDFFDLWCLRESLYKLNGAGHLREVLHFRRDGDALIYPVEGVTGCLLSGIDGCAGAVCQERAFTLPPIRWTDAETLCK